MDRILGCLFFWLVVLMPAVPQARDLPEILIVHSYDPDNFVTLNQDKGIVDGLDSAGFIDGKTVAIRRFYMDTKRTYISPEQIISRSREALQWVRAHHPKVVFAVDDNAVGAVMLPLVDSDTPVVFSGMNGQLAEYNKDTVFMDSRKRPGHNVTGVYEKLHILKSVQVMREVVPDLKKMVFIVDDSPTGNAIKYQVEEELARDTSHTLHTIRQVGSFEEYKEVIRQINSDSEIGAYCPIAVRLSTRNGEVVGNLDVFRWTFSHARKPDIATNYFLCALGAFGGVSVDFKAMGRQAGEKGAAILKGESPGSMPIDDALKFALVFNIKRAEQLSVTIPADLLGSADRIYEKMLLSVTLHSLRLFVVYSEPAEARMVKTYERGLLAGLAMKGYEEGKNLDIHRFYMAASQKKNDTSRAQEALQLINEIDPDLVITLQDAASHEVMLPLIDSSRPVLFGGIQISPETYNQQKRFMASRDNPGHNVSGVTSEFHYDKILEAVLLAFPETNRIVMIRSRNMSWRAGIVKDLEKSVKVFTKHHPSVSVETHFVSTFDAFKELVLHYNNDPEVDIVSALMPKGLTNKDGSVNPLANTLFWLFDNLNKPGFSFCDTCIRYGFLLGTTVDCELAARQLGVMAGRVLDGVSPGSIPIQRPRSSHIAVNLARAEQLHIKLPVDFVEAAQKVFFEMEYQEAR